MDWPTGCFSGNEHKAFATASQQRLCREVVLDDYCAEAIFGAGWSWVEPRRATGSLSLTVA